MERDRYDQCRRDDNFLIQRNRVRHSGIRIDGFARPKLRLTTGDRFCSLRPKQPRQQITDRITNALENPHVDIIAHPTGRLINRREAYEVDIEAVFRAAKENGKLLELNANPVRLDPHDVHCAMARTQFLSSSVVMPIRSRTGCPTLWH